MKIHVSLIVSITVNYKNIYNILRFKLGTFPSHNQFASTEKPLNIYRCAWYISEFQTVPELNNCKSSFPSRIFDRVQLQHSNPLFSNFLTFFSCCLQLFSNIFNISQCMAFWMIPVLRQQLSKMQSLISSM